MLNALRRFVQSHHTELMERFIREDVKGAAPLPFILEWGLHGDE